MAEIDIFSLQGEMKMFALLTYCFHVTPYKLSGSFALTSYFFKYILLN